MHRLDAQTLEKNYPRPGTEPVRALINVSLAIAAGEFVAVRGPSGCGKTTLLLTAGGLLKPDHGRILIDGKDLYAVSPEQRARRRARAIGFVFQQFHLIPYLTVNDNILAPSLALDGDTDEVRQRAKALIERFDLTGRANHYPPDLSTGERQRSALARALINQPGLLLADEPTGNLDPDHAAAVLDRMTEFCAAGGAVLMVTHEDLAAQRAQRILTMRQGCLE